MNVERPNNWSEEEYNEMIIWLFYAPVEEKIR